jgi:AraC-like DNA-binding protein
MNWLSEVVGKLIPENGFYPLRAGFSDPVQPHASDWLAQPHLALVFVLRGCGTYWEEGVDQGQPFTEGSVLVRFPQIRNQIRWDGAEVPAAAFIGLPAGCADWMATLQVLRRPQLVYAGPAPQVAARLTQKTMDELRGCRDADLPSLALTIQQRAVEMLTPKPEMPEAPAWLETAREILQVNCTRRLALEAIAGQLGVGYSTFRQGFKAAYGQSPGEFQIRCRLQLAQERLTSGHVRLDQLGRELGYPDAYTFSKQFRRFVGCSPARFRRQNRLA